jgi:hypothetical protein
MSVKLRRDDVYDGDTRLGGVHRLLVSRPGSRESSSPQTMVSLVCSRTVIPSVDKDRRRDDIATTSSMFLIFFGRSSPKEFFCFLFN